MKALTLWRPWDQVIADGHKPVENRDWPPPREMLGQRIVIHGGAKFDENAVAFIEPLISRRLSDSQQTKMALVCSVRLVGWLRMNHPGVVAPGLRPDFEHAAAKAQPWFFGEYGWLFDRVVKFPEVISCPGRQGLWNLSSAHEAAVLAFERAWAESGGKL